MAEVTSSYRLAKPKPFDKENIFRLSYEIRSRIYFLILRPDCLRDCGKDHAHQERSGGCLNILLTCSRVYNEAIELLHLHEKRRVEVHADGTPVFRHGKDYGKPLHFDCYNQISCCFLPARYSELEFIRFRKVILEIGFDDNYGGKRRHQNDYYFKRNVLTTARAVMKMTDVKQIQLNIGYGEGTQKIEGQYALRQAALLPLLQAIGSKKVDLLLGSHYGNHVVDDKQMFHWLNVTMQNFMINVQVVPPVKDDWFRVDPYTNLDIDEDQWDTASNEDYVRADIDIPKVKERDYESDDIAGILHGDYIAVEGRRKPYQLIPQCRTCLMVFAEKDGLKKHLVSFKHKTEWRSRPLNNVTSSATYKGNYKCWTCAAPFSNPDDLKCHLNIAGHHRYGIIPRYIEDNQAYNLRGKQRMEVFMLLNTSHTWESIYGLTLP